MKKLYVEPLMEAMEIESEGMRLCGSVGGGISNGEATTPAHAREDEEVMEWVRFGMLTDDD